MPQRSDRAHTECLADVQLQNGRRVWVVHHVIPAPSPDDMHKYRQQVYREIALRGRLSSCAFGGKNSRVNLSMDCEDGSVAEVELAADFLLSFVGEREDAKSSETQ